MLIPLLSCYPSIASLSGLTLHLVINCASILKNALSVSTLRQPWCFCNVSLINNNKYCRYLCGFCCCRSLLLQDCLSCSTRRWYGSWASVPHTLFRLVLVMAIFNNGNFFCLWSNAHFSSACHCSHRVREVLLMDFLWPQCLFSNHLALPVEESCKQFTGIVHQTIFTYRL